MNGRSKRLLRGLFVVVALGLGGVAWWSWDRDEAGAAAAEPAKVISPQREDRPEPKTAMVVDPDGRRSEFRRDRSNRLVIKRRFDAAGELETTTVYRIGKGDAILDGRILDARGEDIYRCVYGYSVPDGKLLEEQVHRADREAPQAPGERAEVAYRVLYSAGADGQIGSQVITVGSPEDDPADLPPREGPGLDGDGKPKGIPSAPLEIPWSEL